MTNPSMEQPFASVVGRASACQVGQASACQSERSSDSSLRFLRALVSVSPRLRVKITLPLFAALCALLAPAQQVSIINAVRGLIAQHDLPGAERVARTWQARNPPSPELAAALSWLARGNLEAKNLDQADAFAAEAGKMASRFLIGQKLDDDPWLPTAVGASIEIHAQVLAARGERAEAIDYLRSPAQAVRRYLPAGANSKKHQPARPWRANQRRPWT